MVPCCRFRWHGCPRVVMSTRVYWKICLSTRGAQPYSSIVILCNIGSQLALRTMGTATGTNRMGGGAAGPWRERPLRSPTCRVLRDLNLSKVETAVIRATCAWSGLGWMAGLGGQLVRVRGCGCGQDVEGGSQQPHQRRPGEGVDASFDVLRQWRPYPERLGNGGEVAR